LRRLAHLLGWFVVVDALITIYGAATAPLLVFIAADVAVAWLLILSCLAQRRYAEGAR
jgi:predicted tellurium resistance membrane protein TerC